MDSIDRSNNIKKNIFWIFGLKIISIALTYIVIPVTYKFLSIELYGIWITIFSIMSWINYFDIGIGNGLRNKLAVCLANGDRIGAKSYISSAYIAIAFIGLLSLIIIIPISMFINWNKVLNTNLLTNTELVHIIIISSIFFAFNFTLNIIIPIIYGSQMSALANSSGILVNGFLLFIISFLILMNKTGLKFFIISFGISMVIGNILLSIIYYKKNPDLFPRLKLVDKNKLRDISVLGIKFFIIQIAVLLIFMSSNIIITQLLGPSQVTPYNIAYRVFNVITMLFGLIMTPFWSAFTDAYAKNDLGWMKIVIRRLNILMLGSIILIIIIAIFCKKIILLWIGEELYVSSSLIVNLAIYTIIVNWNNIYSYFLNGIGCVDIQVITAIVGGILIIPLSLFFIKSLKMQSEGVVLAQSISLFIFSVIGPIYAYKKLGGL
jgi:O-antigen/teichoic acid export membrane protein